MSKNIKLTKPAYKVVYEGSAVQITEMAVL